MPVLLVQDDSLGSTFSLFSTFLSYRKIQKIVSPTLPRNWSKRVLFLTYASNILQTASALFSTGEVPELLLSHLVGREKSTTRPTTLYSLWCEFGVKWWFAQCGPHNNNVSITWDLVRDANSKLLGVGPTMCVSGDSDVGSSLRITKTHSQEQPISIPSLVSKKDIWSGRYLQYNHSPAPGHGVLEARDNI